MGEIKEFNKEPHAHHPEVGELADRMQILIDEYAGEIGLAAVIGVLQIEQYTRLRDADNIE